MTHKFPCGGPQCWRAAVWTSLLTVRGYQLNMILHLSQGQPRTGDSNDKPGLCVITINFIADPQSSLLSDSCEAHQVIHWRLLLDQAFLQTILWNLLTLIDR